MLSRRAFIGTGLGALAAGLAARRAFAFPGMIPRGCPDTGALPFGPAAPVLDLNPLPQSVMVDGLPFAPDWSGDPFPTLSQIPFHSSETLYPGGEPPDATETVDICIVGGGLSGLSTAYLLREHRPVILELHDRFGGVAKGERWQGTSFSMGGAYFMTPDPGTFLESFYRELGLDRLYKLSKGIDPMEYEGSLINDVFHSPQVSREDRDALNAYQEIVRYFAEHYPDIPLVAGRDNAWIIDLDRRSFKEDVETRMGRPATPLLASFIQSYFYSSFGAGWEAVSAAAGWNFVAAEEFGRWVLPGGNSGMTSALYSRLMQMESNPPSCAGQLLRAGCRAVEVRMETGGLAKVIYKDSAGNFRALNARRVVMCCSKHIAKYILNGPLQSDLPRLAAMHEIETLAYVVVNVLLGAPAPRTFYDIFLLGDGHYPSSDEEAEKWSRITDFVDGGYARHGPHSKGVLTCYWPLAWPRGRAALAPDDSWHTFAQQTAPQVRSYLNLLGVPHNSVEQIRMTRWGHAFPIAKTGLLARGVFDTLRAPMDDIIFFVDQDNWALPAVETCLLEAAEWAPRIAQGL